jgi:hypothetical protein
MTNDDTARNKKASFCFGKFSPKPIATGISAALQHEMSHPAPE